jgi:hypothetical protein
MELRRRAGRHVSAKVVEQSLVGNRVEAFGGEKLSEAAMGLGVVVIEAVGAEFEIGRERGVPAEADGEDGGRIGRSASRPRSASPKHRSLAAAPWPARASARRTYSARRTPKARR